MTTLLDSLTRRIFASVLLTFALTATLVLVWQHAEQSANITHLEQRILTRVSVAATKLLATFEDQEEREGFIANINAALPLEIAFTDEIAPDRPSNNPIERVLADLGPDFQVGTRDGLVPRFDRHTPVIITLPDGQRLATTYYFGPMTIISPPAWFVLATASGALLGLLVWLSRSLTRQVAALARRASEYDPIIHNIPFPISGPSELRSLASAFNRMIARISTMIDSQRVALSAVGHDLRTPITRLKLRAEALPSSELRQSFLREIDYMKAMVDEALGYLRGGTSVRPPEVETTDLTSILGAVADDYRDLGKTVRYEGPARLCVIGHSENLFRLFDNLLANAARYADNIWIAARADPHNNRVIIEVDDDGAGLEGLNDDTRLDSISESKGEGLGLPIARSIAMAHGGGLCLLSSPMGGLRVEVTLAQTEGVAPTGAVFFETLAELTR